MSSFVAAEIASQPEVWARAAGLAPTGLARTERVAIVGCGTSLYMARACAALREAAGAGETDAFAASEFPAGRRYDRIVAITRSGTTTEVLRVLSGAATRRTVVTTSATHPAAALADEVVLLDFADEQSVVQTRFATAVLAWWRATYDGLGTAVADARREVDTDVDSTLAACAQFSFLGTGWTVGLAEEAALKLREAAQAWTEAYPAMEFRHGPISVVDARSAVWVFGDVPDGLAEDVAATGARLVTSTGDPMALLVRAQKLAVALAERRGLDPDRPRALTRSIVLE